MCGILGAIIQNNQKNKLFCFQKSLDKLTHRGPNSKKYLQFDYKDQTNIFLGHTRLSIIDLHNESNQPMKSKDERFYIIFNGEIYNYIELKKELTSLGYEFNTKSDTEVLLYSWIHWGEQCLRRLVGMFSFVIYDRQKQNISCVRDAFGIKPFFYFKNTEEFIFASELAALLDLKSEKSAPDLQKSYDYLVFGKYDHHNNTFFKDIKHLPPGYLVQYDVINKNLSNPKRWWAPQPSEQINISYNDAIYQVRNQFLDNLKLHLRSDVNIGASLSGGLDSSAIVCGMRYLEPELPIHTFSYIPSDQLINEEKWIDLVNLHTKAHANKIYFSENDFNQDLDDLIKLQGEPFGSTSIYAQYQVFKKIKQKNIVVTLEGQGADELLGGYQGYPNYLIKSLIENKQIFQSILFANNWSKTNNKRKFSAGLYYTNAILPEKIASAFLGYLKINASHDCLNINYFKDHDINFLQTTRSFSDTNKGRRLIEKLLSALTSDGLPSLLRHADRNSMYFSIESRVPFLSIPMVEFILSLPESYLVSKNGVTKNIFREAMKGIIPEQILNRNDKIGFQTPEKNLLQGMNELILKDLLNNHNIPFINKKKLTLKFEKMLNHKIPYSNQLWRWINYIKWYQQHNF